MADEACDVLLAHNSADKPTVAELAQLLRDHHQLDVWFDVWKLQPGLSWQDRMKEGIRGSKAAAVLIGNDGLGRWEDEEMKALLQ